MAISKFSFSKKNFSLGWVFCIYSDTGGAKITIFILDFAAFKAAQNGYFEIFIFEKKFFFGVGFLYLLRHRGG